MRPQQSIHYWRRESPLPVLANQVHNLIGTSSPILSPHHHLPEENRITRIVSDTTFTVKPLRAHRPLLWAEACPDNCCGKVDSYPINNLKSVPFDRLQYRAICSTRDQWELKLTRFCAPPPEPNQPMRGVSERIPTDVCGLEDKWSRSGWRLTLRLRLKPRAFLSCMGRTRLYSVRSSDIGNWTQDTYAYT